MLRECIYGECTRAAQNTNTNTICKHVRRTLTLTLTHTITTYSVSGNVVRVRILIYATRQTPCRTRNSSGDEIANVNFLYDDIVHVLQNTIDSCINSATDRRRYVLVRMFTKFSEITQYNGHYTVQGHSRSPILVPIESSYTTSY